MVKVLLEGAVQAFLGDNKEGFYMAWGKSRIQSVTLETLVSCLRNRAQQTLILIAQTLSKGLKRGPLCIVNISFCPKVRASYAAIIKIISDYYCVVSNQYVLSFGFRSGLGGFWFYVSDFSGQDDGVCYHPHHHHLFCQGITGQRDILSLVSPS